MSSETINLIAQVQAALAQQQWQEAISYFKQLLDLDPENPHFHNNYAALLAKLEDYSGALRHYHKAVTLYPGYTEAHQNLGLLFFSQGEFAAAITQFNNVLVLSPDHSTAHYQLANSYMQNKQYTEAEQHYSAFVANEPDHIDSLNNLGVIALATGKAQLAADYFTKVLVINPEHYDARSNLAATFIQHRRYEQALTHYQELLNARPNDLDSTYNTGVANLALGQLKTAKKLFTDIIYVDPDHVAAITNLGSIALRDGDRDQAINFFQRALQLSPHDEVVSHMLAAITGASPQQAPLNYAKNLFDNYALHYEQHLTQTLQYQLPQQTLILLQQFIEKFQQLDTCDIGCGTGLFGVLLRPFCKHLVGVDLSAEMLTIARQKNCYDDLYTEDFQQYLATQTSQYNLISAIDVLGYVGDLTQAIAVMAQALQPHGYAVFSVEMTTEPEFILQHTVRYAYNPEYLMALLLQNHLHLIATQQVAARSEQHQALTMTIYLLQKQ